MPAPIPTTSELNLKPWKYIGWPGFTRFAASDNDFLVLRRFDVASTRVLLMMQDDIAQLEESLNYMDMQSCSPDAPDRNNGSFREEHNERRAETVRRLKTALLEYKQMLWFHSELKARPAADAQSKQNVEAWLWNHPGAVVEQETEFVKAGDLINVVSTPKSPIRKFLERVEAFKSCGIFRTAAPAGQADSKTIRYYSDRRVDTFADLVLLGLGLVMLICPLWILELVRDTERRLAFISCSILVFMLLVSLLTPARPSEAFAATAAYSAVLMVFLQLGR